MVATSSRVSDATHGGCQVMATSAAIVIILSFSIVPRTKPQMGRKPHQCIPSVPSPSTHLPPRPALFPPSRPAPSSPLAHHLDHDAVGEQLSLLRRGQVLVQVHDVSPCKLHAQLRRAELAECGAGRRACGGGGGAAQRGSGGGSGRGVRVGPAADLIAFFDRWKLAWRGIMANGRCGEGW